MEAENSTGITADRCPCAARAAHALHTSAYTIPLLHRLYTHCTCAAHTLRTRFTRTAHICTHDRCHAQAAHVLHTGCTHLQTRSLMHRLYMHCTRAAHVLHTDCTHAAHALLTGCTCCTHNAHGLHTCCTQAEHTPLTAAHARHTCSLSRTFLLNHDTLAYFPGERFTFWLHMLFPHGHSPVIVAGACCVHRGQCRWWVVGGASRTG